MAGCSRPIGLGIVCWRSRYVSGFACGNLPNDYFAVVDCSPFLACCGCCALFQGSRTQAPLGSTRGQGRTLGWALLIYALVTFVYFYKTIVDGQYVSKYKDHVIRVISEGEYRMFPNLWTRVTSAWIGMMAVFCARSFSLPQPFRSERNG